MSAGPPPAAAHPGLAGEPVYLGCNVTTPVDPRVITMMLPYLARWSGDPSSDHEDARRPRQALAAARAQAAALIGARPQEII